MDRVAQQGPPNFPPPLKNTALDINSDPEKFYDADGFEFSDASSAIVKFDAPHPSQLDDNGVIELKHMSESDGGFETTENQLNKQDTRNNLISESSNNLATNLGTVSFKEEHAQSSTESVNLHTSSSPSHVKKSTKVININSIKNQQESWVQLDSECPTIKDGDYWTNESISQGSSTAASDHYADAISVKIDHLVFENSSLFKSRTNSDYPELYESCPSSELECLVEDEISPNDPRHQSVNLSSVSENQPRFHINSTEKFNFSVDEIYHENAPLNHDSSEEISSNPDKLLDSKVNTENILKITPSNHVIELEIRSCPLDKLSLTRTSSDSGIHYKSDYTIEAEPVLEAESSLNINFNETVSETEEYDNYLKCKSLSISHQEPNLPSNSDFATSDGVFNSRDLPDEINCLPMKAQPNLDEIQDAEKIESDCDSMPDSITLEIDKTDRNLTANTLSHHLIFENELQKDFGIPKIIDTISLLECSQLESTFSSIEILTDEASYTNQLDEQEKNIPKKIEKYSEPFIDEIDDLVNPSWDVNKTCIVKSLEAETKSSDSLRMMVDNCFSESNQSSMIETNFKSIDKSIPFNSNKDQFQNSFGCALDDDFDDFVGADTSSFVSSPLDQILSEKTLEHYASMNKDELLNLIRQTVEQQVSIPQIEIRPFRDRTDLIKEYNEKCEVLLEKYQNRSL